MSISGRKAVMEDSKGLQRGLLFLHLLGIDKLKHCNKELVV